MILRRLRSLAVPCVFLAVAWTASRAWGIGFGLSESKVTLKLNYDVSVTDHGTGRVTVALTLADEGRLKPLDEIQLVIPSEEKEKDGSHWMDLVVSIKMSKADNGKHVGHVHLRKDWAERAQIQLNTHTMDGNWDPLTRLHHVIPLAKHMTPEKAVAPTKERQPN